MSTHTDPHHRSPYRVPDGYFSDLRQSLRSRISPDAPQRVRPVSGVWRRLRGVLGLSAAFCSLVLFATLGYYLTGYLSAPVTPSRGSSDDLTELLYAYQFNTEEIEALAQYASFSPMFEYSPSLYASAFADEVASYLETYGYGAYLEAALNGEAPY